MPGAFPCTCFNTADEEMFEVTWLLLHGENLSHPISLYRRTGGCCAC